MGAANILGAFAQVGSSSLDIMAKGKARESALGDILADRDEAQASAVASKRAEADAAARGRQAAGLTRMQTSQLVAKQRAAYSAGGVDASVGTAADVQTGTRALGELEAQRVQNNAMREAWGHKTEAETAVRRRDKLQKKYRQGQDDNTLAGLGDFLSGVGEIGGASASTMNSGVNSQGTGWNQ